MSVAVFAIALLAAFSTRPASSELPIKPEAANEAQATVSVCAFCRAPLSSTDFCSHCGRLSRIVSTSSEHRFWADAPYVLAFPPLDNTPEIQSDFSENGLVHESVRYSSGDRYELKMEKKGPVVHGRVGWMQGGKETDYSADIEEVLDGSRRLSSRQVIGKVKADPDVYLYRKLDYRYSENGLLDRIEFKSWFYRGSSDWKKSPAAWLRHSAGEILMRRDSTGVLTKIETTLQDGKRSLRGEPEYDEPHVHVELVTRNGDHVDRVMKPR